LPKMPPIPDIEMEEEIIDFIDGATKMGDGIDELIEGNGKIVDAGDEINSKSAELTDGINKLADGCEELDKNSEELILGLDSSIEGIGQIKEGTGELSSGLEQLVQGSDSLNKSSDAINDATIVIKDGAAQLVSGSSSVTKGINDLLGLHGQLLETANILVASNKEGSDLYNLGMTILMENEALSQLSAACGEVENGIKGLADGAGDLQKGFEGQFVPGLKQFNTGINEVYEGSKNLYDGIDRYEQGQIELKEGFSEYADGVKEVSEGIGKIKENIVKFFDSLKDLFTGQKKIGEGLEEVKSKGIVKLMDALKEGLEELRFGKAKKEKMEDAAESYISFMDNDKNRNSSVQFIMQTKEIKIEEKEKTNMAVEENIPEKKNFWQKFKDLWIAYFEK